MNGAGIVYTETTMGTFKGFREEGTPEFARARKAAQYAESIDDFVRIMSADNNGAYANDWLVGDTKTGEIAKFELGLKNQRLWRTMDGYFIGSNFPGDEKVIAEETTFDPGGQRTVRPREEGALGAADGRVQGLHRRRGRQALRGRPRRHGHREGRVQQQRALRPRRRGPQGHARVQLGALLAGRIGPGESDVDGARQER